MRFIGSNSCGYFQVLGINLFIVQLVKCLVTGFLKGSIMHGVRFNVE
jgi:hypothetical protein